MRKQVEELIDKAAKAPEANDAMKFAQAAQNAAAALCGLASYESTQRLPERQSAKPAGASEAG